MQSLPAGMQSHRQQDRSGKLPAFPKLELGVRVQVMWPVLGIVFIRWWGMRGGVEWDQINGHRPGGL